MTMRTGLVVAVLALSLGCGSSSSSPTDAAPVTGGGDGPPASSDTSPTGADLGTTPGVDTGTAPDAPAGDVSAPAADAAPIGGDVMASAACLKFCECMAKNCADKTFPHGCLQDCTAGTKWDLECRQAMCNNAPAQPLNNHCTHALGMIECLDKP